MADKPKKRKAEGELALPKEGKKRMKDSGEESIKMNPDRGTVATQNFVSEVTEDRNNLEMILNEMRANLLAHGERITELEKKTDKLKKETDKLKKEIDKLKKKTDKLKKKNDKLKKKSAAAEEKNETIKNENKKKEACQKFLLELKDLSVLKDIAQKIKNKVRLDYRQDKIVKQYLEEFEESKKVGIGAYFDAQNCVGHRTMTVSTVDDCIKVLNDYPDLPTLYDVNCSNEEAFDFLESCRGCVEDVQSYARLKLPPIQKKTQAEKDEERNKSRKESKARKAKWHRA